MTEGEYQSIDHNFGEPEVPVQEKPLKKRRPRRVVLELTMAEARALDLAVGNSLTCGDDAESICGKRLAPYAYAAAAKLREEIAVRGGYDKKGGAT